MKICKTIKFFLFAVFLSSSLLAQINTFDLTIFEPLPEMDLSSLPMVNDLSGAPRVFQISILPAGNYVVLHGEIFWTDIGKTPSNKLFEFTTKPFKSTTFYNTDLGNTEIRIANTKTETMWITELAKRGKPVGKFDINLYLKDSSGATQIGYTSKFVEFINPTQSFTILTPTSGSELQQGNIVVSWIQVPGADHYKIRVNSRVNSNQSLETALMSGNPIIDFDQIQNSVSSIKLNDLPNRRPILEGQELVLQIVAVIRLPTRNRELPSEIINFNIAGFNDARDNAIKNALMSISQSLPGGSTFASVLSDKNLKIIRVVDENGNPISQDQLRNLLNYLNTNPERVISAQFIYNTNQ